MRTKGSVGDVFSLKFVWQMGSHSKTISAVYLSGVTLGNH